MKQNIVAKIMATVALGAILIGIIGTSIIFIFGSTGTYNSWEREVITSQELQGLIDSSSGAIAIDDLNNVIKESDETIVSE